MEEIRLPGGQKARLNAGRVEVLGGPRARYRLMVAHRNGGEELIARCHSLPLILGVLSNLERLGYELKSLGPEEAP